MQTYDDTYQNFFSYHLWHVTILSVIRNNMQFLKYELKYGQFEKIFLDGGIYCPAYTECTKEAQWAQIIS